jgi:hypothetical protein
MTAGFMYTLSLIDVYTYMYVDVSCTPDGSQHFVRAMRVRANLRNRAFRATHNASAKGTFYFLLFTRKYNDDTIMKQVRDI